MRILLLLAILYVGSVASRNSTEVEKKIVCYFGSWTVYRQGKGQFNIDYIDPNLCTHLIYAFVGLKQNDVFVIDAWQDLPVTGKNAYGRFNELRKKNPALKTLVAMGGWEEGSVKYSEMARNKKSREEFVINVVKFVKKYGFDGFDLDWEYPARRGGAPADVKNYIKLLQLLKKEFDKHNLILSAAVSSVEPVASISYKISEVCNYLDFVNIMAYDIHGAFDSVLGFNAPLHAVNKDNPVMSVEASVKYWLHKGCSKDKMVLGVPLYGRTFTLINSNISKVGDRIAGPGLPGPYSQTSGILGYNEICIKLSDKSWKVGFDKERGVPYAQKDKMWIGYDDPRSLTKKAELIEQYGLSGAMVWSIESDDFRGECGKEYPLLRALNSVLRNKTLNIPSEEISSSEVDDTIKTLNNSDTVSKNISEGLSTSTDKSLLPSNDKWPDDAPKESDDDNTTVDDTTDSITDSSLSHICTKIGNIPKPNSCNFISCAPGTNGNFNPYEFICPSILCYDADKDMCDWPKNTA